MNRLTEMRCNVCTAELSDPIYESEVSLTSLCAIFPQSTRVRLCGRCSHLQTDEIDDAASFYDADYSILTNSDEEDQIYEVKNGKQTYRTEHQAEVLLEKLDLWPGIRILDYGCAKSAMMRILKERRPNIDAYLYDVSDRYVRFWEKFLPPSRWAIYDVPHTWQGRFDVVTSFFALEHITRPAEAVQRVASLLKPGGTFYGIVPDVLTNSADLIVIDHVNHFTRPSLDCLLSSSGLRLMDVDLGAHRGAFVFVARRDPNLRIRTWSPDRKEVAGISSKLRELAGFWAGAAQRLRDAERRTAGKGDLAVYGAGFYGAFVRCCLAEPHRVRCFVDQNPHLQGRQLDGARIVAPDDLPEDVNTLFVGLNPAHASSIIANVEAFVERDLTYFYI